MTATSELYHRFQETTDDECAVLASFCRWMASMPDELRESVAPQRFMSLVNLAFSAALETAESEPGL